MIYPNSNFPTLLGWFRGYRFLVLLVMCCSYAAFASAENEKREYDIPEGLAIDSIKLVAHQGGVDIVFDPRIAQSVQTPAIRGFFTPRQALERLLAKTPLIVVQDEETTAFAVRREGGPAPNPDDQGELALKPLTNNQTESGMNKPSTDRYNNSQRGKASETRENKGVLSKVLAGLGLLAMASTNPAIAQENNEDVDIFTLNPFDVSETENVGYQARSTLAGTRLNAPLRDIAATISVVTEEFLEDTNSTDLQSLLVYTANTEVLGIGGNFANPNESRSVGGVQDSQFKRPNQNTRVRGLAAADLTRNYFSTLVPMDSYNTSRVVINRGANAILFGLGSPAGIINSSTIAPLFVDHGEVSFQGGSYGSFRTSLDIEKVLIEDKLSIRVAALFEDKKYKQEPAFEEDKRIFAVGEYRPFENTTIRTSFESGSIDANRPRTIPPQDMVSRWFDVAPNGRAKPVHDSHNWFRHLIRDGGDVTGGTPKDIADNLYWGPPGITFEPAAVFAGPEFGIAGGGLPNGTDAFLSRVHPRWGADASNGISFQSFMTIRGINQLYQNMLGEPRDQNGNLKSETRNFYVNEVIQDTSLFDFRNLLIDGPNKSELEDFDVFSASVDQLFLEGQAGLSYFFNKEEYRSNFRQVLADGSRFQAIAVDPNITYPNGNVNPNFGRLFISSGSGSKSAQSTDLENHRLTGFFKFNATEKVDGIWGKLLGDHTLTGLIEDARSNRRNFSFTENGWGKDYQINGAPPNPANFTSLGSLVYVSDSIADQSSSAGANASNLRTKLVFEPEYTMSYFNPETNLWDINTFSTVQDVPVGGNLSKNNIESKALILHSDFLDNHLVATYGYREDEVDVWSNNNPPRLSDNTRDVSPSAFFLPDEPTFKSKSDSSSWGVVGHVPDFVMNHFSEETGLSVHYSKSENSQIGTERTNLLGKSIGPVSGDTEEKGFTISFLNNKISIRTNWYETLQVGENSGLTGQFNGILGPYLSNYPAEAREQTIENNLLNQDDIENLRNYDPLGNAQYVIDTLNIVVNPDGETITRTTPPGLVFPTDLLSEGFEVEAIANITDNWRLMFNVSQQEVSSTNTAPLLAQFIRETVEPTIAEFGKFPAANGQIETIKSMTERGGLIQSKIAISEDGGIKTNEVREWRFNLATNYAFAGDSAMKGWNIGGAVRWQDEIGIGRPVINDPELGFIPDLDNPIFGPDELKADIWIGWQKSIGSYFGRDTLLRVQLNIRNLFDEDDLIPVVANPDGTIPVVRIPDERTFELRATFSY